MATADVFAKVSCTYCQEEINGVRVQCCECSDFDICLQCFVSGAEIGPHRNDHSYKFVDHCAIIIGGRGNWTGREELQLLDAVELYGFGNWDLVSQHVKTRTPEEVKEEYISRYLEGNIGKATWGDVERRRPVLIDHVPEDTGPLAPTVISKLPPLDITPEEAILLGYKPHRDDYEREYDMPAEQLVSSLQLDTTQDSKVEILMKLAMVDMYSRKLRERTRRKRVVRDYQLVSKFFSKDKKDPNKKPLTKEQKELRDNMRVFSQFQTSAEHERLISNIERERELRVRLQELLKYRNVGITSQEEAFHYEQHASFQRQQIKVKTGNNGNAIFNREDKIEERKSEKRPSSAERSCTSPSQREQERHNYARWSRSSSYSSNDEPPIVRNDGLSIQEEIRNAERNMPVITPISLQEDTTMRTSTNVPVVQFLDEVGLVSYMH